MQRWLLAFALSASLCAHADTVKLIPLQTPSPVYPYELRLMGFTGKTQVKFTVNSDGSVSDIKVIKSSHLLLSRASRRAIRDWRFKPWSVTADQPSKIHVVAPMIFSLGGRRQLPMDINTLLTKISCNSVNTQMAQRDINHPKKPLHELTVFSYLSHYLSNGIVTSQLSEAERENLISEFEREIPQIVERCEADPDAYYADQLPASVRELL